MVSCIWNSFEGKSVAVQQRGTITLWRWQSNETLLPLFYRNGIFVGTCPYILLGFFPRQFSSDHLLYLTLQTWTSLLLFSPKGIPVPPNTSRLLPCKTAEETQQQYMQFYYYFFLHFWLNANDNQGKTIYKTFKKHILPDIDASSVGMYPSVRICCQEPVAKWYLQSSLNSG